MRSAITGLWMRTLKGPSARLRGLALSSAYNAFCSAPLSCVQFLLLAAHVFGLHTGKSHLGLPPLVSDRDEPGPRLAARRRAIVDFDPLYGANTLSVPPRCFLGMLTGSGAEFTAPSAD